MKTFGVHTIVSSNYKDHRSQAAQREKRGKQGWSEVDGEGVRFCGENYDQYTVFTCENVLIYPMYHVQWIYTVNHF